MNRICLKCHKETTDIDLIIRDRSKKEVGIYQTIYEANLCKKCFDELLSKNDVNELIKKKGHKVTQSL